jgi:integrase
VADLVNHYIESLNSRLSRGQISDRHFSDCVQTGELIVKHFGRRVEGASLQAADFSALRQAFPSSWGNTKTGLEIQRIRSVFRWAAEAELIRGIPNFGPDFKKPAKSESRRLRAKNAAANGSLDFSAEELKTLLAASNGWLKSCVLLGINAGFGNFDCGRLRSAHIDFSTGRYDLARPKSGIPRQCIMWSRTLDAIQAAMVGRPVPKVDADDSLCFLTTHGRPVIWELVHPTKGTLNRCDNVGKKFTKLVKACGIRGGRGFYSLRRTFEMVAGNTKDQVAVNMVMGHSDATMAEIYRQGISEDRLADVAKYVENWLFGKQTK